MKIHIPLAAMMLAAGTILAADPKDDVASAAKQLAAKDNYSWKTTVEGGGGRGRGPVEGKIEKDGFTFVSMAGRDNTSIEVLLKGGKGAIKLKDEWQSLDEAAKDDGSGTPNMARFIAMRMKEFKAPAAEAESLAGKTKELKSLDDSYTGDLTEDGAKGLLAFRRPGGGDGPTVSNAKGSATFWVKDGVLTKYQFKVQGNVSFNGNDRDVDRTTTVEIKDVGKTKVDAPEEAKKKLS